MKKTTKKSPDFNEKGRFSDFIRISRFISRAAIASSVAIILSIVLFDAADDVLALTGRKENSQKLTVSDLSELPDALEGAGMVKHPRLFSLYLSFSDKEIKRNSASVNDAMDYRALLAAFTEDSPTRTLRVTIPKSASTSDIIDIFVNLGLGSRESFVEVINNYPFEFDFLSSIPQSDSRIYRLEGYLYPDTYDIYTGRSESYYIGKLLERFETVMKELEPIFQKSGVSPYDALTVASLIECSAGFSSSYERMSAVIYNRLSEGECLEIPAASVYGAYGKSGLFTGIPDSSLKELDSPYNTFINTGLPPSPVCNPSKEAILCAVYPENSKYYFFVTQKNGSVLFAKTIREHRENLARADAS